MNHVIQFVKNVNKMLIVVSVLNCQMTRKTKNKNKNNIMFIQIINCFKHKNNGMMMSVTDVHDFNQSVVDNFFINIYIQTENVSSY